MSSMDGILLTICVYEYHQLMTSEWRTVCTGAHKQHVLFRTLLQDLTLLVKLLVIPVFTVIFSLLESLFLKTYLLIIIETSKIISLCLIRSIAHACAKYSCSESVNVSKIIYQNYWKKYFLCHAYMTDLALY